LAGNSNKPIGEKLSLEILTDDPGAIIRYIEAESNVLKAGSQASKS